MQISLHSSNYACPHLLTDVEKLVETITNSVRNPFKLGCNLTTVAGRPRPHSQLREKWSDAGIRHLITAASGYPGYPVLVGAILPTEKIRQGVQSKIKFL